MTSDTYHVTEMNRVEIPQCQHSYQHCSTALAWRGLCEFVDNYLVMRNGSLAPSCTDNDSI
jgi:hypothetical protein